MITAASPPCAGNALHPKLIMEISINKDRRGLVGTLIQVSESLTLMHMLQLCRMLGLMRAAFLTTPCRPHQRWAARNYTPPRTLTLQEKKCVNVIADVPHQSRVVLFVCSF